MSTWLYKIRYAELVKFNNEDGEPDVGSPLSLTALADDAEDAIAKVRKGVVGQKRTVTGCEDEEYNGKVVDLRIDSVESISFVDIE